MWQSNHEKIFLEAADQLHFGRNLVAAVLSLQSWHSFVARWLDALFTIYEADSPNLGRKENLLRAAKYLSKVPFSCPLPVSDVLPILALKLLVVINKIAIEQSGEFYCLWADFKLCYLSVVNQIIKKGCEDGVPRVAENATLALAALCKVILQ